MLALDPGNVTALLWLVWLSEDPRASMAYVARALTNAAGEPRVHAALRWARRRASAAGSSQPSPSAPSPPPSPHRWIRLAAIVSLALLIMLVGGALVWRVSTDLRALAAASSQRAPAGASCAYARAPAPGSSSSAAATHTPCPTETPTDAPTPANTATDPPTPANTPTEAPTPAATPTDPPSPASTATDAPSPAATPTQAPTPANTQSPASEPSATPPSVLPAAPPPTAAATPVPPPSAGDERWIDVDLTNQTLTAYEGQTPVRTTLVSTGVSRWPTPVGQYRIWIKLRYDDMRGPDYYLPDVPYVMYFHKGYGLHGTYWHSNFGHRMSHGCINLPTAEAEWFFNWAEVGTLVNVHN